MPKCEKHDDQMTEWIMCLKAAKEVWDAAFLKDDKYEVGVVPELIYALAKEIYQERTNMRQTVLHKESAPEYTYDNPWKLVIDAHDKVYKEEWAACLERIHNLKEAENGDERRGEPTESSAGDRGGIS